MTTVFDPDIVDPVGEDSAVQAALLALDDAITAAAAKDGQTALTIIVAWVIRDKDGSDISASFLAGDTSAETLAFACDAICDDSGDVPMPGRVLN